jgi:hypothetical protein
MANNAPATGVARWQLPALVVGVLGLALSILLMVVMPNGKIDFFRSWLTSYLFWFSIAAGSLTVLMLQYVTGGEWGLMVRRPLGAAARTMPLLLVLFVPLLIPMGTSAVYPWMDGQFMHHMPEAKRQWLNWNAVLIRTLIYFAIWIFFAWRLRVLSLRFYEDRAPETELRRRKVSSIGIGVMVVTLTLASFDWMMSLEPAWMSSMYGITFIVGCGLSALTFVTFFLTRIADTPAMKGVLKPQHLRDLGNLTLAFVMFYTYTAFSEFLLIWYGNIKEEVPHYIWRQHGGWGWVAAAVVLLHFFLPFFLLLMRPIKDRAQTIGWVAILVLVMRYVTIYWVVAPSWTMEHFHYSLLGLSTLAGIGGIWLWAFLGQLKGQSIIPIHETWVEEAIREGAVKIHG